MNGWFELSLAHLWGLGGALIAVAVALLALLLVTLPPRARRKLRTPTLLFAVYVLIVAGRFVFPVTNPRIVTWTEVVGIFVLLLVLARGVVLFVTESRVAAALLPPIPKILADIAQALLFAAVVLVSLRTAGVDMSSLLTTSAILSAVLGFALQDTLGNVFAGLAIQAQQPFEIGDWVEVDGKVGQVLEISWRAMKVLTLDHVEVIVPNGALAKGTIRNFTKPTPASRRNVEFSAPYDVPAERVQDAVLGALAGLELVLASPAPSVVLSGFAESAMTYTLRYFTSDFAAASVTDSGVRDRIWHALKRADIAIPLPQRDVHLREVSPTTRAAEDDARLAERRAALSFVSVFDVLTPDAKAALARRTDKRLYGAGETILRQGEEGDALFVVLCGEVSVVLEAATADGGVVEVARLDRGKFFGEMSLLTGERRAATVRAARACELLVVGHDALQGVLDAHPELAEQLSRVLAERQLRLDERQALADSKNPAILVERSGQILTRIRAFFDLRR